MMLRTNASKSVVGAAIALFVVAAALAGCAPVPAAANPIASPAATSQAAPLQASTEPPTLDGAVYTSIGGSGDDGELGWLADEHAQLWFTVLNDSPTLVVAGVCGPINLPFTVVSGQLITGGATIGEVGCLGSVGEHHNWILEFFAEPLDYSSVGDTLVLSNSVGTIEFSSAA